MNSSEKFDSPYYPRRARWYAGIFYFGGAIRHRLALDRIYLPRDITPGALIGSFLIPGLGVYLRGPRLWGQAAMTVCFLLFTTFILWLGYPGVNFPFGNYALGLMISIHAIGFVYYCSPVLVNKDAFFRILFTVAVLLALGLFLYKPSQSVIQNHWLIPLRVGGQTVVVNKTTSANDVKRDDWIAYSLSGHLFTNHGYEDYYNRNGMGLGPVLATAGDTVTFSADSFSVNGVARPLLPHMPVSGTLTIGENQWFIWPSYSISGQGDERRISSLMLGAATVAKTQFIGKPFKHWFWRKQILP